MKALKLLPKPGVFRFRLSLSVFFDGGGVTLTKAILPVGREFSKNGREPFSPRFLGLELRQQASALSLPGRGFESHPSMPGLRALPSLARFIVMLRELDGSVVLSPLSVSTLQVPAVQLRY